MKKLNELNKEEFENELSAIKNDDDAVMFLKKHDVDASISDLKAFIFDNEIDDDDLDKVAGGTRIAYNDDSDETDPLGVRPGSKKSRKIII